MNVKLTNKIQRSPHIYSFYFSSEEHFEYIAGQFIELSLPEELITNGKAKRWFTLSSSPTERDLTITTRIPEKPSDFKRVLLDLKLGSNLNASSAMGDFVLPIDKQIPLIFVAGGIGITPYRSMLKWLADSDEKRDITLLFGVAIKEDLLFEAEIRAAGCKLIPFIDKSINAKTILDVAKTKLNPRIYLSGPEPMTERLYKSLIEQGAGRDSLMTDYFPGYLDLSH